jgi:hypothetical protein
LNIGVPDAVFEPSTRYAAAPAALRVQVARLRHYRDRLMGLWQQVMELPDARGRSPEDASFRAEILRHLLMCPVCRYELPHGDPQEVRITLARRLGERARASVPTRVHRSCYAAAVQLAQREQLELVVGWVD